MENDNNIPKAHIHKKLGALVIVVMWAALAMAFLVGHHNLNVARAAGESASVEVRAIGAGETPGENGFDPASVSAYAGVPSSEVNGGVPFFTGSDLSRGPFEAYSELDELGRCGTAFALVSRDTMPKVERGSIGMVRPSGWQIAKYDWIEYGYLYNRCHLLGYQLTAENANPLNLITGTRYLNVEGMQPYENEIASYVRRTGNSVLYRVTPVFSGNNLVADGVLLEAESVEDAGVGIRKCVWCYNVQPGVAIDYATGESRADGSISGKADGNGADRADAGTSNDGGESGASASGAAGAADAAGAAAAAGAAGAANPAATPAAAPEAYSHTYVLNKNTFKFHLPNCSSVADMSEKNKLYFDGSREEAIEMGYVPCNRCRP